MRLLLINPNTTASMTEKVGRAAELVSSAGTEIVARNPATDPASIQGAEDGEAALPGLFEEIDRAEGFDAIIIACFDDTGLYQARRRTRVPVIGIGEAAYHYAMLVAERFSVVTTLSVSIPVIQENIMRYGLRRAAARCARRMCQCWSWSGRGRRREKRSPMRSPRHCCTTIPTRSCLAAPVWPTSRLTSPPGTMCQWSMGSLLPSSWRRGW